MRLFMSQKMRLNQSHGRKFSKNIALIISGLLCFVLSGYAIPIDRSYDLYINVALFIPAIAALSHGSSGALLCCIPGMAIFGSFLILPANGWGNLVTSAAVLTWSAGHGLCTDMIRKEKFPFYIHYIYQFIWCTGYLLLNNTLIHRIVLLNQDFWTYAYSYLPDNIINANAVILVELLTIYILVADCLMSLPTVKRLFHRQATGVEKDNYAVAGIMVFAGVISAFLGTGGVGESMLSLSFSVDVYQSSIGNMQLLLLKEACIAFGASFLIHFFEYHNRQELEKSELAETQKAVFESSRDMIWSIHGITGKVITSNESARKFLKSKNEQYQDKNFPEIFDGEEYDLWCDYLDKAEEKGDYETEYFDFKSHHYYDLQIHRINISDSRFDIAVFAKNMTEQILLDEKIESMNEELEMKVLERTQEIQDAYSELEHFCYKVAHEFKAPLRAIEIYNEIVREETEKEFTAEAQDANKNIGCYCRKTLKLVGEILEYSKMKSKKLHLVQVNLYKMIEQLTEEFRILNPQQDIHLNMKWLPNVMGDELLIRCCLYNIIGNAVKYSSTRERTEIEVDYENIRNEYIFSITDNGVGFDMDYTSNLFEMFGRMHKDEEYEGNGIGLVTVKNIIEKHGGTIDIKSAQNAGCTVRFALPK